jgi:DMSO/TMAO reductase YedYZ heme-binding membrane subunit
MSIDLKEVLKHKAINGWGLFCLVCIPMCLMMIIATMQADMSTGPGVSTMIGFSVRWAVPFIFLVVAASSVQVLFPGPFPAWLSRNRKYIGFCFAVAMFWQASFIFIMSNIYRDYYINDVYLLRDELEGTVGYIFLVAMVLTSFNTFRKRLNSRQWKLINKCGIYFLWAYPFSVYWWTLFYYQKPEPIDYVFYVGGFVVFASRIAAWGKKRHLAAARNAPAAYKMLGGAMILFGLVASVTGGYWQKPVTAFLTSPQWSADLVLWLPFWPFEPFLPLLIMAFGTLLVTRQSAVQAELQPE